VGGCFEQRLAIDAVNPRQMVEALANAPRRASVGLPIGLLRREASNNSRSSELGVN
jgi:hypothetical protein